MKSAIKWVVGVFLILGGLGYLVQGASLTFLFFILGGLVCLPPSLNFIETKLSKKFQSWQKYLAVLVALFLGIAVVPDDVAQKMKTDNNRYQSSKTESTAQQKTEQNVEENKGIGIGQVLKSDYFEIIVNKASIKDRVNTGNSFADLKPEQGSKYLIINTTFKNIDEESRMIIDGSVWINYNGKDYEFDKSETIMLEGWGLFLDQINPLISKTTNLVYKLPEEIKGDIYWQPGRASKKQKIFLGHF